MIKPGSITLAISGMLLMAFQHSTLAQNANQAAVDTLVKDVAVAVFAGINQPKAQEIHARLLACGDGCDPQQVVRGVGSWDQVGEKMQELATIKNTARFMAMSPADANAAIRNELTRFYTKYKANASYGKPLSMQAQAAILDKIDELLPPAATVSETPSSPTASPPVAVAPDESESGNGVNPGLYRQSKLERQLKEQEEKHMWMLMLVGGLGIVLGASGVYLLGYRRLKNRVDDLLEDNRQLNMKLENQQKQATGRGNSMRQPDTFGARPTPQTRPSVSPVNPPPATPEPKTKPMGTVPPGKSVELEPRPTVQGPPQPAGSMPALEPAPAQKPVAQDRVFYCPPPDPNGQFDANQQTLMLSPESAYRFSVTADRPTVASFRFEAEPGRLPRLLTYRNYMIEPACDSENSYTTAYTNVVMRRDGEAVLENGGWRVKTKALIRYE